MDRWAGYHRRMAHDPRSRAAVKAHSMGQPVGNTEQVRVWTETADGEELHARWFSSDEPPGRARSDAAALKVEAQRAIDAGEWDRLEELIPPLFGSSDDEPES